MTSTLPSTQDERRLWLIRQLAAEQPEYAELQVPVDAEGQRQLLRALMNVRPPLPAKIEIFAVSNIIPQRSFIPPSKLALFWIRPGVSRPPRVPCRGPQGPKKPSFQGSHSLHLDLAAHRQR